MKKLSASIIASLLITIAFTQTFPSFEKREMIRGMDTLRYRVQYPINYNAQKKYPLVLFLHGAGERGSDNEAQLVWGGALFADSANRLAYPVIVIFPQCPKNDFWARISRAKTADSLGFFTFTSDVPIGKPLGMVCELLDSITATGKVNTKKIYLAGLSMGGMGSFELLWRKPGFFAAAAPICGGGDPSKVSIYAKKFPIWIFHGDKDNVVPIGNSRLMANALKSAKAKVMLTEYPGVGHDSWKNAFAEPDFLKWMFSKKK